MRRHYWLGVACGLGIGLPAWIATVAVAAIVDNGNGTATYSITAGTHALVDMAAQRGWYDLACDDDTLGADWPVVLGICTAPEAAAGDPLPTWICTQTRVTNGLCWSGHLDRVVPRASTGLADYVDGEIRRVLRDLRNAGRDRVDSANTPTPDYSDPL